MSSAIVAIGLLFFRHRALDRLLVNIAIVTMSGIAYAITRRRR